MTSLHFNILDDLSFELSLEEFYVFSSINDLTYELLEDPHRLREYNLTIAKTYFYKQMNFDRSGFTMFASPNENFRCHVCQAFMSDGDYYMSCGDYFSGYKNHKTSIVICQKCYNKGHITKLEARLVNGISDNYCSGDQYEYRNGHYYEKFVPYDWKLRHCYPMRNMIKRFDASKDYIVDGDYLIDITPIDPNRIEITEEFQSYLKPCHIDSLLSGKDGMIITDIGNSIMYWSAITEPIDMYFSLYEILVIVNCEKGSDHEVAILAILHSTRGSCPISFYPIFDSFSEYKQACDEWHETKPDYSSWSYQEIRDHIAYHGYSKEILTQCAETFAEYIWHGIKYHY